MRRRAARRRVVLAVVKRLQGGFRGILAALDADRLDPLDAATPSEVAFRPLTRPEKRARELRDHRREKRASRRSPF